MPVRLFVCTVYYLLGQINKLLQLADGIRMADFGRFPVGSPCQPHLVSKDKG
jgi:hypothetical protein